MDIFLSIINYLSIILLIINLAVLFQLLYHESFLVKLIFNTLLNVIWIEIYEL